MLLMVIVKKALVPCFTDVRSCDAGSGIMGFMVSNRGSLLTMYKLLMQSSTGKQGCHSHQIRIHSKRSPNSYVSLDRFDVRQCASRSVGRNGGEEEL